MLLVELSNAETVARQGTWIKATGKDACFEVLSLC